MSLLSSFTRLSRPGLSNLVLKRGLASSASVKPLLAERLKIIKSKDLKTLTPNKDLLFGRTFTDHDAGH
ncbi:hypothetical protein DSO57_1010016 [Entomophthora muscae]|uniref:Uncharacterized protein n=1 Tax=Entomophthora muscae TaxID=34485 RepID=A0ACC2S8Q3_9FUNG|nr:hypothetical protein DSO57_1010016 [Entomophthora muscae]